MLKYKISTKYLVLIGTKSTEWFPDISNSNHRKYKADIQDKYI